MMNFLGETNSMKDEEEEDEVITSSEENMEEVMSEVHLGCPPHFHGRYTSYFTYQPPFGRLDDLDTEEACKMQIPSLDKDGDLVLVRRQKPCIINQVIIQHKITSSIPGVGLQVWRAELILADFILHKTFTSLDLNGVISLELGAGTGLVGILLARVAKTVFLTDHGEEILNNCSTNVQLNNRICKDSKSSVIVRELDWKKLWPPPMVQCDSISSERYGWTSSEINECEKASLLLAADVIYSDILTDALFTLLEKLMSCKCKKILYLALEKRYNFTIDDLGTVANGYSRFQSYLKHEHMSYEDVRGLTGFIGKQVDILQIPQYIREYDRGNDLEIWEIHHASHCRED